MLELLGEWGDPRGYLPLARFMAIDEETLNELLDASITESAERVMAAVATDDLEPIFALIRDGKADEYARGVMYGALIRIAVKRPHLRDAVAAFLTAYRPRATTTALVCAVIAGRHDRSIRQLAFSDFTSGQ